MLSQTMLSQTSMNHQSKATEESDKIMDVAPLANLSLKNVEVPLKPSSANDSLEKTHTTKPEPKMSKSPEVAPTSVVPTEADVAAGVSAVKEAEAQRAPAVPVVETQTAKKEVHIELSSEEKVEGEKVQAVQHVEPETTEKTTNEEVFEGRKVRFSVLEIRDYPICVGDNPAVSKGVPITIDWTHDGEVTALIDDYENSRGTPRSMLELRIPPRLRTETLKGLGFTGADMMLGTKAANIVRLQRRRTIEGLQTAQVEEFLEKSRRAFLNATIMRGKKRREREYLYIYKTVINEPKRKSITENTCIGDSSSLIDKDL